MKRDDQTATTVIILTTVLAIVCVMTWREQQRGTRITREYIEDLRDKNHELQRRNEYLRYQLHYLPALRDQGSDGIPSVYESLNPWPSGMRHAPDTTTVDVDSLGISEGPYTTMTWGFDYYSDHIGRWSHTIITPGPGDPRTPPGDNR